LELEEQGGRFHRVGLMAEIFPCQVPVIEFRRARRLPEEIQIHLVGKLLRRFHETVQCRLAKTDEHVGCLDLGTPAVLGFDVQGGAVVGEDGAHPEVAILEIKGVHGANRGERGASLP